MPTVGFRDCPHIRPLDTNCGGHSVETPTVIKSQLHIVSDFYLFKNLETSSELYWSHLNVIQVVSSTSTLIGRRGRCLEGFCSAVHPVRNFDEGREEVLP